MDAYKKVAFLVVIITAVALTLFSFLKPSYEDLEMKQIQPTPQTQSLEDIIVYKFPYMGNAHNYVNLFYDLPLGNIQLTVRLFPDDLTGEVNYEKAIWDIGEEVVFPAILYNSVVAFALIDNLEYIVFNFVGSSHTVSRYNVERTFANFNTILIEDNFITFQEKLNDYEFVIECLNEILV